jgi:hypothetical protein
VNESETVAAQQQQQQAQTQLKGNRCQGASTLMKGLNRTTTSNRMNLSSDILKVEIDDGVALTFDGPENVRFVCFRR